MDVLRAWRFQPKPQVPGSGGCLVPPLHRDDETAGGSLLTTPAIGLAAEDGMRSPSRAKLSRFQEGPFVAWLHEALLCAV